VELEDGYYSVKLGQLNYIPIFFQYYIFKHVGNLSDQNCSEGYQFQ